MKKTAKKFKKYTDLTKSRPSKGNMIGKCPVCGKNGKADFASYMGEVPVKFKFVHKEENGISEQYDGPSSEVSWSVKECLIEGIPKGFVLYPHRYGDTLVRPSHVKKMDRYYLEVAVKDAEEDAKIKRNLEDYWEKVRKSKVIPFKKAGQK